MVLYETFARQREIGRGWLLLGSERDLRDLPNEWSDYNSTEHCRVVAW